MGRESEEYGLDPNEEARDLPRVVEEAYEILSAYGMQLGLSAAMTFVVAMAVGSFGSWLAALAAVPVLVVLVLLYFVPITREPRLAKEVLRRWDVLRIERALESSGIPQDPRLEVAESMAHRIIRHPSVDERTRVSTAAMVARLKRLLNDARRTTYLIQTQRTNGRADLNRSVSDLQDLLDARAAEVIARLADVHHAVVLRDDVSLERVLAGIDRLMVELGAEVEVERLLADAERSL